MPSVRGLRKRRPVITYSDSVTGQNLVTLQFTQGRDMAIIYDGWTYHPVSASLIIRPPGAANCVSAPIDLNDGRLEDIFHRTKQYVDAFGVPDFGFDFVFKEPITIQGYPYVVGIDIYLPPVPASSEHSVILSTARVEGR